MPAAEVVKISGCCACCREHRPRVIYKAGPNCSMPRLRGRGPRALRNPQIRGKGKVRVEDAWDEVLVTLYYLLSNIRLKPEMAACRQVNKQTLDLFTTKFLFQRLDHLCLDGEVTNVTSHLLDTSERRTRDLVVADTGVD
jgi:hypothetical protein